MYKAIFLALISCTAFSAKAQWSLNGNSGTNPPSNFIGTLDNKDLVFKTNNIQRFKISQGTFLFNTSTVTGDGVDFIDDSPNRNAGTDIVWISSSHSQANDTGLLTVSSSNWQYPVFSARENGKILMGIAWNNTGLATCSDCNSYRLFVKDGIKTEKIKVEIASAGGWADYVFNKDYKLKSLEDLKAYIDENKHLPEVPSTEDVLKNGVELKEMNVLLLKKVEELTLHMIEMNERLKKQDEQINSMNKRK
jgi:hypothetical protein